MRSCTRRSEAASARPRRNPHRVLLVTAAALLAVAPASAQDAATPARSAPPPPAQAAEDSPRATVASYLDLCRDGRYGQAARHLALDADRQARSEELARRLKAVLDRHLWVDLATVSGLSRGNPNDDLPPDTDLLGTIAFGGRDEPVLLVRERDAAWVFSAETVSRIDRWYARLGASWLHEHLPELLLRPGPLELVWWQWLFLPIVLATAWALGRLLAWATLRLLSRVSTRTHASWDDALLAAVSGPLVLAWTVAAARPLVRSLGLYAPADAFAARSLGFLGLVALFWGLWRGVAVGGEALARSPWAQQSASGRSLLSLGVRMGKGAVAGFGVLAALSHLGYPVAGLLAGLGLGGLAFALAAQKTLENLFGSLSLAMDGPFRVGDFVKVEEFVGTVEALGLRSTRIRTLDRTLITIPNARLAEMRLESFTARDRLRLACTIGLVYATTIAQMREVLQGLEDVLRRHPLIWPDTVVVRFKECGASSLDIEIMAWFQTADWSEFQLIRQEVLLQFMEVVEHAGSSFAFPTRTVHLVDERPLPGNERQSGAEAGPLVQSRRDAGHAFSMRHGDRDRARSQRQLGPAPSTRK